MEPMDFIGEGKRLDLEDLESFAEQLGTGVSEIQAVLEIEAGRSGFDHYGRPKILFEPHVFYRHLSGEQRKLAVSRGLAYKRWKRNYPADSYPRLCAAIAINETAALKSASWGGTQILGENHKIAGYETVQEMVEAFADDEYEHIQGMVNFIIHNGLDRHLRNRDWASFARGYNGSGYKKNKYDTKLAAAYRRYAGGKSMPNEDGTYPTLRKGSHGVLVGHLQKKLQELNYSVGTVDSQYGKLTRDAVMAFQADNNLKTDGVCGPETWETLDTAEKRVVSSDRIKTSESDLRKKGSSTIKASDKGQATGVVIAATAAIEAFRQNVGETQGILNDIMGVVNDVKEMIGDNWMVVGAVVGFVVWYQFRKVTAARIRDHRSGTNLGR